MTSTKLAILAFAASALLFPAGAQAQQTETAIFAGGCFWTVESDFDHAPGVVDTTSGYIGGHVENPDYDQVVTETTGHREAVKVTYDPSVTSYDQLLVAYWHLIDPTQANGQFCDRGESYTTGIFATSQDQLAKAEASKLDVAKTLGKPVTTTIGMAPTFYPAEDYHQNFWKTNPEHYLRYRQGCGKNARVEALWGKDAFKGLNGHL